MLMPLSRVVIEAAVAVEVVVLRSGVVAAVVLTQQNQWVATVLLKL